MRGGQSCGSQKRLRLRVADTFFLRLLGLHVWGGLAPDEGLVLTPCRAVHTCFLRQPIDVVFLDDSGAECGRVLGMLPYRVAREGRARCVVELPENYCRRHPDYLQRIQAALQRRAQSAEWNTLI